MVKENVEGEFPVAVDDDGVVLGGGLSLVGFNEDAKFDVRSATL